MKIPKKAILPILGIFLVIALLYFIWDNNYEAFSYRPPVPKFLQKSTPPPKRTPPPTPAPPPAPTTRPSPTTTHNPNIR